MEHISVFGSVVIWAIVIGLLVFALLLAGSGKVVRFFFGVRKVFRVCVIRGAAFLTVVILVKMFFLEINRVSGQSMEDTLQDGDYVLIVKCGYGPRLPRSFFEIPWLNVFAYVCSSEQTRRKYLTDNRDYRRLASWARVKKGEIVAFNLPPHQASHVVKRCLGGPGDFVRFREGQLPVAVSSPGDRTMMLPFRGMQAELASSPRLYRAALTIYSKKTNDLFYTFERNYYYLMGDNPPHSQDSRHWGLLQEDHIIGKVVCVLFSVEKGGKICWNRCLKKIN